jgi:dihydroflavonol-4-reductase
LVLETIRRHVPGYIEGGLSIVHVDEAARVHVAALTKGRPGERYILAGINVTQEEFFQTLSRVSGVPAPRAIPTWLSMAVAAATEALVFTIPPLRRSVLSQFNRPVIRLSARQAVFDCAKAEAELGYRSATLEGVLRATVSYHLERGDIEAKTPELRRLKTEVECHAWTLEGGLGAVALADADLAGVPARGQSL